MPAGCFRRTVERADGELAAQLKRRASGSRCWLGRRWMSTALSMTSATEPVAGQLRLRWSYRNTGDYDHNGEANISDLTPIGLHFAKTPAALDWQTAMLADGDFNTEVNISDITPLGLHFMQSVTSYHIEFSATSETGGFTALSDGAGRRGEGRAGLAVFR